MDLRVRACDVGNYQPSVGCIDFSVMDVHGV